MYVTEPIEQLVHFLRVEVDEVTRYGLTNRQTNTTQSFNGNGVLTSFTLTNIPVCVNSVTVGGVTQTLYLNYNIDLQNKIILFAVAPGVGTGNIVVDYDYGGTWIYPDMPREDLKKTNYPRLGVTLLNENSQDTGMNETDTYDTLTFQIDVIAYKDMQCTISTEAKFDVDVVQYLARQIIKKIHESRFKQSQKLMNPVILNNFPVPFDEDKHIVRRIIEVKYEAVNAGR